MPSFRVLLASDRAGLKNVLLSQPRAQSCTRRLNRAFIIGTVLNVGFVVIEAFFGIVTQSLALLVDAGHNLSDVLGLLLAWGASFLSQRPRQDALPTGYVALLFWQRCLTQLFCCWQ